MMISNEQFYSKQTDKIHFKRNIKSRIIDTIKIKSLSRTINQQHFLIQLFKKQLKQVYKIYDREALLQYIDYLKVSETYDINIALINPYELISRILVSQTKQQQNPQSKMDQQKENSYKTQNIKFLQKKYWISIINGSLQLQGVKFQEGQALYFQNDDFKFINNLNNCQFIYLTHDDIQRVAKNFQIRQNSRCQFFIKNALLYNYSVPQKQMINIFNEFKIQTYKKKQIIYQGQSDQFIRILYKGQVEIQVQWKRTIRLCQLTSGSIFNGPLNQQYFQKFDQNRTTTSIFQKSYFFKTQSKKRMTLRNKSMDDKLNKKSQQQKFRYICSSQEATVILFPMNLLDESPLSLNHELKFNLQSTYQNRIIKSNLIKKQTSYNKLHRMQKSYENEMKRNKQKQQSKKNITQIQYLQDKSMRQRFFTEKGNINALQKPQSYRNNSSQKFLNPRYRKIQLHLTARVKNHLTKTNFFSQHKKNKKINIEELDYPDPHLNILSSKTINKGQLLMSPSKSIQRIKKVKSFSTLTRRPVTTSKIKQKKQRQQTNLFVPQQFVNRKLRLQFQNILKNVRTLPLRQQTKPLQKNMEKQIQLQNNQRFQKYIKQKKVMNKKLMKYYGNSHKYLKKQ